MSGSPPLDRCGRRPPARAEKSSVAEEKDHVYASKYPSLVLLGILLPGLDSFSAALEIRTIRPHAKIAILTRHALPDQMLRARRLHLNGYILTRDDSEELFYAIKTIMAGGFYTPPSMSNVLRDQVEISDPLSMLTQREKTVLALYAQGPASRRITALWVNPQVSTYSRWSAIQARTP
jgi:DNA-binding NarL/FixJ family response regulator